MDIRTNIKISLFEAPNGEPIALPRGKTTRLSGFIVLPENLAAVPAPQIELGLVTDATLGAVSVSVATKVIDLSADLYSQSGSVPDAIQDLSAPVTPGALVKAIFTGGDLANVANGKALRVEIIRYGGVGRTHNEAGAHLIEAYLSVLVVDQDVTDHGALTGLLDDDHTQYALADGSRGNFDASGAAAAALAAADSYADGILAAHVGAADPHTGYRLESADHSHQSSGLQAGNLDHGLALTGLGDDDHTQYPLSVGRAGGQIIVGGSGVTDVLTLQGTSGNGTLTGAALLLKVGNNGGATAITVLNNGKVGLGVSPAEVLDIVGNFRIKPTGAGSSQTMTFSINGADLTIQCGGTSTFAFNAPGGYINYKVGSSGIGELAHNFCNGGTMFAAFKSNSQANYSQLDMISHYASNFSKNFIQITSNGGATGDILILDPSGNWVIGDGKTIAVGSTTGTKIGTATTQKIGFYNATPVVQQTDGAGLTNNVTSGGTTNQIDDFTDLATYATDAAAIRNDIYQLARKQKIVDDALRAYGLLS